MLRKTHIIILLAIIPLVHVQAAEQTNAKDKPSKQIQALIDKAGGGDAESQFNLAQMYEHGLGVEQMEPKGLIVRKQHLSVVFPRMRLSSLLSQLMLSIVI